MAVGIIIFTSSASRASAQSGEGFSKLTLKMQSTKDRFVLLEPVPLILTLKNETAEPIEGHSAIEISQNYIKLFVKDAGNETRQIKEVSLNRKLVGASVQMLEPGKEYQSKQILSLNLDELFPRPGTYRLHATLINNNGKKEIKSNTITIHVLEPEGIDQQAFEYIKEKGTPATFFSAVNLPNSKNTPDVVEEFVYNYSGSVYGDYATFLLGEFYFGNKDYAKAQEKFSKIAGRSDFILADKAKDLFTKSKDQLAKSTEQERP